MSPKSETNYRGQFVLSPEGLFPAKALFLLNQVSANMIISSNLSFL